MLKKYWTTSSNIKSYFTFNSEHNWEDICIQFIHNIMKWMNDHPLKVIKIVFRTNEKMNLETTCKLRTKEETWRNTRELTPICQPLVPWMLNSTNISLPSHKIVWSSSRMCKFVARPFETRMAVIQWSEALSLDFIAKPSRSVV